MARANVQCSVAHNLPRATGAGVSGMPRPAVCTLLGCCRTAAALHCCRCCCRSPPEVPRGRVQEFVDVGASNPHDQHEQDPHGLAQAEQAAQDAVLRAWGWSGRRGRGGCRFHPRARTHARARVRNTHTRAARPAHHMVGVHHPRPRNLQGGRGSTCTSPSPPRTACRGKRAVPPGPRQ